MGNETSKAKYSKMEGSQSARQLQSSSLYGNNGEQQNEQVDNTMTSQQTNIEDPSPTKKSSSSSNNAEEEPTTITKITAVKNDDEIEEEIDESDSKLEKLKKGMIGKMNTSSNYAMIPAHE